MTTSKQAVGEVERNARPVPESRSEPQKKSGESVPKVDSTPADHPTVADRILRRLDEMDSRVGQLAATQDRQQHGGADTACLERLQAEISGGTNALAEQFSEALNQQNHAIAGIASALSALQESFTRSFAELAARAADEDTTASASGNHDHTERKREASRGAIESTVKSDGSKMSAWDEIKNAFLIEESSGRTDDKAGSNETLGLSPADDDTETIEAVAPDDLWEVPELLDIDGLSDAELRSALVERECMMSTLVQRLVRKVRSEQSLSPEQLKDIKDALPDELAAKVEKSLRTLSQQERLGQLDLCLERARISRQLSTLAETRGKLESSARRLGMTISEDGLLEGGVDFSQKSGSKGRRWLTVMGFGN